MNNGRKEPICCQKYLNTGTCDNHEKYGEKCRFTHYNKAQFEAACKRLNT